MQLDDLRISRPFNDLSIELANLIFLDLETTGLRPDRGARITELEIISRNHRVLSWNQNESKDSGKSIESIIPKLGNIIENSVIVGHNIKFDLRFLAYYAERLVIRGFKVHFIDTLGLAKSLINTKNGYTLSSLLKEFDISVQGPLHTAAVDTEATRALFWKLINLGNIETLSDAGMQRVDWTTF